MVCITILGLLACQTWTAWGKVRSWGGGAVGPSSGQRKESFSRSKIDFMVKVKETFLNYWPFFIFGFLFV